MSIARTTGTTYKEDHIQEEVLTRLLCVLNIETSNRLATKILTLLKHLDGLEGTLDNPSDHPRTQVLRILSDSERWPITIRHYWIARQISNLSAFYYQTTGDRDRWNPLNLSRTTFCSLNTRWETWYDESPFPEPNDVLAWLSA